MSTFSSAVPLNQPSAGMLSLLFTDSQGMVIFADRNFARLAHYLAEGFGLSGPLHSVLGIGQELADEMFSNVKSNGMFLGRAVDAHTRSGSLLPMWGMSVASYDDHSGFIGADLIISDMASGPHPNILLTSHIDVLTLHLQQTMAQSRTIHHQTYIQAYMSAQFNVLEVLLARMAGPMIREVMEATLNSQIARSTWPLKIKDGELEFTRSNAPFGIYGAFQSMAISYATSVVGRRVVAKELAILDSQLDPATFDLVTQLGLRMQ